MDVTAFIKGLFVDCVRSSWYISFPFLFDGNLGSAFGFTVDKMGIDITKFS
eukprot:m.233589 g.233589  ORF g.233589 m.233589 type:complete len:51 (+) comp15245_c1_seq14:4481-4633(+)